MGRERVWSHRVSGKMRKAVDAFTFGGLTKAGIRVQAIPKEKDYQWPVPKSCKTS